LRIFIIYVSKISIVINIKHLAMSEIYIYINYFNPYKSRRDALLMQKTATVFFQKMAAHNLKQNFYMAKQTAKASSSVKRKRALKLKILCGQKLKMQAEYFYGQAIAPLI